MPSARYLHNRYLVLLLVGAAIFTFVFLSSSSASPPRPQSHQVLDAKPVSHATTLSPEPIMPKLGNETAKAELGRATWKYFHTVMARFPVKPSVDESESLRTYIHLFTRLYPCGECAQHFSEILEKFPPQVSSRSAAAVWACHVHNEVNKSLNKDIFDCANIGDFYDCGCAEDEDEAEGEPTAHSPVAQSREKPEMSKERIAELTGESGRDFNVDLMHINTQR